MTVLAGDLGGTKTLLALCDLSDLRGKPLFSQQYDSRAFACLEDMVERFLAEPQVASLPRPESVGLGVAGPVESLAEGGQRATITNLGYSIESRRLAARFGFAHVELANDFHALSLYAARVAAQLEATVWGAGWAAAAEEAKALDVAILSDPQTARPVRGGTLAVLGAGTGMGQALVLRQGVAVRSGAAAGPSEPSLAIVATEGGHTDFAPRDEVEIDLLRYLSVRHPEHVSVERVLCGGGLHTLYEFFASRQPNLVQPAVAEAIVAAGTGAPAVISAQALAGTDTLCAQAVQRFVMLYGAEASNLALKSLASGGVVIGGGVARRILPKLQDGLFLEHFLRKGRFRALCQRMPIYVLLDPLAGLRGAAYLVF